MKKGIFCICMAFFAAFSGGCSGEKENRAEKAVYTSAQGTDEYSQLSSQGQGWGFVRKKGSEPEILASQSILLEKYNGYYLDKKEGKSLYLTFDEGYENGFTAVILDVLKKTKTPAAFFVTGPYLENQGELVKRMIDEGHIVGNHTVHHLNLPKQPSETVKNEILGLNSRCEELYGYKMQYIRPPEGEFSEKTLAISNDLGMKTIMWSFAYKDWEVNSQKGASYAYENIVPYLHDGAIILLHAVSSDNASALENVINKAIEEGYVFKSLNELSVKPEADN